MSNIQTALAHAKNILGEGDSPELDAELLLAHCLQQSRSFLYTWPEKSLTPQQRERFDVLVQQRQQGIPIAYLLGYQEFWSLRFRVTPDVLIPRPDTEVLVEQTLASIAETPCLIADLGTGSGAIACALAHERPQWQIMATDKSEKSLAIAQENASDLKLNNITFYHGDWLTALPNGTKLDAIISNPPYIAPEDPHLKQTSLPYEPQSALIADNHGLADIHHIIRCAPEYLKPQGRLLIEHGYDQAKQVGHLMEQHGFRDIQHHLDLGGHIRVTIGSGNIN